MIEFCTKKRMIAAIIFLIGICVMVLVIENHFPIGNGVKNSIPRPQENASELCDDPSSAKILENCRSCNPFEQKTLSFCKLTSYIERVKCPDKDKEIYRSCPQHAWVEEQRFWIFEGCSVVVGLASYGVVFLRQRRLDRLLIEKVNRQIAAGV